MSSRRYTGPDRRVIEIVRERSGGRCEFPDCGQAAQDPHHRTERLMGGRGPKGPDWINTVPNILAACRHHNQWVSNDQPREAERMGWLLRHGDHPTLVPVQTCHDPLPVFLLDDGSWVRMEVGGMTEALAQVRVARKERHCGGDRGGDCRRWIGVGEAYVRSALPPGSDLGNTNWWTHPLCGPCARYFGYGELLAAKS